MKLRNGFLTGSILSAPLVVLALSAAASAQPVQGLYIAGEGGATFNQDQQVRLTHNMPSGRDTWKTGAVGIGSIGYGLGNGFRVELEGNYRNMDYHRLSSATVSTKGDGRRQTSGLMANALFDLDIGKSWLFPYFGAGIGYGWTHMHTSITGLDRSLSEEVRGTHGGFTYQGIFGLAFPVPWVVGLSATAEYRFWTMLAPQGFHATALGTVGGRNTVKEYGLAENNRSTATDFNHSLMLGLRYEFNPAPPPPPPAEVAPAPMPTAARTYLVFFDWDDAGLSDRARSIVSVAAQASGHTALTRIQVSGYTDTSAAHQGPRGERYNMALSIKRAETVKAELIRDGVAGSIIDVQGYGQTHPMVPTGPGVREPQNRRVEIVLR
ncbi:OmpA family protein [Acetobacter sicerae]|uniref:OmpA family protein n=1 Tax=Acetobacter sicerae TaxID=85325 RepID=UPI00156B61F1|nr:OmpA family protein [Acetobacter sicerae]NHN90810.1 OmpA family protein [Acetobacter sicerae]